jgi:AI-2 transport protein TqsA
MVELNKIGNSAMNFSIEFIKMIAEQISNLGVVIFSTLFLILEANGFSRKLKKIIGSRNEQMLENVQEFTHIIIEYIIIRTKVNLTIGVSFSIVLYLLGVEGAVFWGFLMFVFGYIPYVGFIIAVIPPTFIAWIDNGPLTAVLVLLGAIIINSFAENILFPQLAGKGLNLSPAVIFIALLFWGFLLGGSGIILGVPLTVLVYSLLKSSESTKWAADLMSSDIDDEEPENIAT